MAAIEQRLGRPGFRDLMLGPGYVADPMSQYRNFPGRDPASRRWSGARAGLRRAKGPGSTGRTEL